MGLKQFRRGQEITGADSGPAFGFCENDRSFLNMTANEGRLSSMDFVSFRKALYFSSQYVFSKWTVSACMKQTFFTPTTTSRRRRSARLDEMAGPYLPLYTTEFKGQNGGV
jgi:hypothetical protein